MIALASAGAVTSQLKTQGGDAVNGLGEQAYGLRTTAAPQQSYWALGGDATGAMYGGLQIAENIRFNGLAGIYNAEQSPTILKRGIKLNLPWDKASATYGRHDKGTFDGTSSQLAIADVWDMTFWQAWFDEMARNRYNIVSLWSCNPFSSLVKVPGYEDCSIENVTLFDGTVKPMTIDQKIKFWQEVMAYADSRGFEFLIFNWNVFTYGATGKHGISDGKQGSTDPDTIDYMYKAMTKLLETYPDLGRCLETRRGSRQVWRPRPAGKFIIETFAHEHPIMKGLPPRWMHAKDEFYHSLRGPAKNLSVLGHALSDETKEQEPLLMAISYGKGRVLHTTLGHYVEALDGLGFQVTFARGTEWAATGMVTQPALKPGELTEGPKAALHPLKRTPKN